MNGIDKRKGRTTKWCLYVLKCIDNTLYTGITIDLTRRLREHNEGRASRYTRSRLPVILIYEEPCGSHSSALRKECAVKRLSRKGKEKYIKTGSGTLDARSSDRSGKPRVLGRPVGRKTHE